MTIVSHKTGECPCCGNSNRDSYFDNPEDEYTVCYECGKQALNHRWYGPEDSRSSINRTQNAVWEKTHAD